jgi:predicted PurR-regulated permease PerM
MKKSILKFLIGLLVGLIVGVLVACIVYFCTVDKIEWQTYIKEDLIPNIVICLTSISAICVAALPIISNVQNSIAKFDKATKDVNDTVETGKSTIKSIDLQDQKITSFANRFDKLESELSALKDSTQDISQIVRLGFCNMDELVQKGYAVEIEKVAQNEHEKVED